MFLFLNYPFESYAKSKCWSAVIHFQLPHSDNRMTMPTMGKPPKQPQLFPSSPSPANCTLETLTDSNLIVQSFRNLLFFSFGSILQSNMSTQLDGACTCKALQFTVSLASPDDARTSLCHCTSCRRAFGTNFGLTTKVSNRHRKSAIETWAEWRCGESDSSTKLQVHYRDA